jgi:hypothetical protein
MMFKRDLLEKVLSGLKTQTRRLNTNFREGKTYTLKKNWVENTGKHIKITKTYNQKLGEINYSEIIKEGFSSLEEFREVWIRINGKWEPDMVVTVYEFELAEPPPKQSRLDKSI